MTVSAISIATICGFSSLVAAATGAVAVVMGTARDRAARTIVRADRREDLIFLMAPGRILDASPAARDFLGSLGAGGWSRTQLERTLTERFPDLPTALRGLADGRSRTLTARDGSGILRLHANGDRVRLSIGDAETQRVSFDRAAYAALEKELVSLRAIAEGMHFPVWRQRLDGGVTWVNSAYLDLADRRAPGAAGHWPPPVLFDELDHRDRNRRMGVELTDGSTTWFDCAAIAAGDEVLVTATPADAQIAAEKAKSETVQTLSRTFAHLTVGLAIFDRSRRLAMFNPALTDLTGLPIDLLLANPTLESFLDALRSRNLMPEPKDYASWREKVVDVEKEAANGTYGELWHLPGNRTYRIAGQPQPDGAFALLLEDISAEVSLTRQFRAQIETSRAVIDALDDGVAVFDRSGAFLMSNPAYDRLWGVAAGEALGHVTSDDALALWTSATEPTGLWDDARAYLSVEAERQPWSETATLQRGGHLRAHFTPLSGGATMVRFEPPDPVAVGRARPDGEARLKA